MTPSDKEVRLMEELNEGDVVWSCSLCCPVTVGYMEDLGDVFLVEVTDERGVNYEVEIEDLMPFEGWIS
jgi:hypothetical protein